MLFILQVTVFTMKFPSWLPVYGNQTYRGPCPHEAKEQAALFEWMRRAHPRLAALALHPRNEGKRTARQARRHKAEGLLKGAPDLVIMGAPTALIELKRADHTLSRWEPSQLETLRAARAAGCWVAVGLGARGGMEAVEAYLASLAAA